MILIEIELLHFFPNLLPFNPYHVPQFSSWGPIFLWLLLLHTYINMHICIYTNIHSYMYIWIYTYIYIYMHTCLCISYTTYILVLLQKAPWMRLITSRAITYEYLSLFQAKMCMMICYSKHSLSRSVFLPPSPTTHRCHPWVLRRIVLTVSHWHSSQQLTFSKGDVKEESEEGVGVELSFWVTAEEWWRLEAVLGSATVFCNSNGHTVITITATLKWSHGIVTPLGTWGLVMMVYATQQRAW